MVFNCCFTSWLTRWRRKNDGVVEVLQIGIHALQYKFILGVLGNGCLKIVRNKVFSNAAVKLNCVDRSFNKARQFLVKECFSVNKTAYANCCCKEMDLVDFTCIRFQQQERLISDPVDIHLFSGYSLNGHRCIPLTIVSLNEAVIVLVELGLFVSIRMFSLILDPAIGDVYLAAFSVDPVVVVLKIW